MEAHGVAPELAACIKAGPPGKGRPREHTPPSCSPCPRTAAAAVRGKARASPAPSASVLSGRSVCGAVSWHATLQPHGLCSSEAGAWGSVLCSCGADGLSCDLRVVVSNKSGGTAEQALGDRSPAAPHVSPRSHLLEQDGLFQYLEQHLSLGFEQRALVFMWSWPWLERHTCQLGCLHLPAWQARGCPRSQAAVASWGHSS